MKKRYRFKVESSREQQKAGWCWCFQPSTFNFQPATDKGFAKQGEK
jgi:hypothetical protein